MIPRSTSTRLFKAPGSALAMLVLLAGRPLPPGGRPIGADHGRAHLGPLYSWCGMWRDFSPIILLLGALDRSPQAVRAVLPQLAAISLVPLGRSPQADGGGGGEQVDCRFMTEPRRPLEGIRVLELAQVVAGPFCGALMAEFGAEVIKTEMPGRGDDLRRLGPSEDGCEYWFAVDNRNKKLMTLDLHLPKGQDIVRRLVSHCDVVLENFRPGVLERWGLGWEALHAINPRLVMARITAFGQTGPLNQGPGYAAIGSAFGGTWYLNGPADRPPARPTPVYPDYMTGLFTAFGVMAALRHRDATGEGQWIDATLYESAFRVLEFTTTLYGRQGVVRERGGLQHAGWPGGAFETQDGKWIVFTAPAQHLFERLCAMIGQPELPRDPRFASAAERPKHVPVILDLM